MPSFKLGISRDPGDGPAQGVHIRRTPRLGRRSRVPRNTKKIVFTEGALWPVPSIHQRMKLMSPRSGDQSPYEPLRPRPEQSSVPSEKLLPVTARLSVSVTTTKETRKERRGPHGLQPTAAEQPHGGHSCRDSSQLSECSVLQEVRTCLHPLSNTVYHTAP